MKKRTKIKLAVISVLALGAAAIFSASLDKSIGVAVEAEMKNACERLVSRAVSEACAATPRLYDVLRVEKDQNGVIAMVNVDSTVVNELSVALTESIQKGIDGFRSDPLRVPAGNLFLSRLFSGSGPMIEIGVFPNPSCRVEYDSSFAAAGINQTVFTLYVSADISLKTRVGVFTHSMDVSRKTAVCDIIIVGNVPQTYANLLEGGDFLNLVP